MSNADGFVIRFGQPNDGIAKLRGLKDHLRIEA